ncbi:MAG: LPS export ABC transporter periplasmic protein LptC [Deltaproteobacteria bacterium]|nr:LPS export ABC transporter periplasmic protein LptC [Deltaproteobacteria bacterium]
MRTMKKHLTLRNLLFVCIVLVALALAAMISHNFRETLQPPLPDPRPKDIDLSLKEVVLTSTQEETSSWQLNAEAADFNLQSKSGKLKNIRMVFFDAKRGNMELTADTGEVEGETSNLRAIGHVVLRGAKDGTLYADDLEYVQKESLIRTDNRVRIVSERMELRGQGLRYQTRSRFFQILNNIEAQIYGDTGKK